jgi:hypothetical protein
MSGAELECARAAYRGSLEAARAQRAFSPSVRHGDTACWSMLGALFAEPGMNRTMLVGRISQYAGVSRATAERLVSRARATGHIVDQPSGKAVRYFLSQRSFDCCIEYYPGFPRWIDVLPVPCVEFGSSFRMLGRHR